jgi:hypothetical protein
MRLISRSHFISVLLATAALIHLYDLFRGTHPYYALTFLIIYSTLSVYWWRTP